MQKQSGIRVTKVSSGWNGEYQSGVRVSTHVELGEDDLAEILRSLGFEGIEIPPILAYRVLRIESQRRLLDVLRDEHGEEPEEANRDRRELNDEWVKLLQEISEQ